MDRIDIKIGFACNNHCAFCVQGEKRQRLGPRSLDRILLDLEEGRANGASGVVMTGGEPTLQPTLPAALRMARELGYEVIQIQSNGRRLCYEHYCRELIAAGANEFSPALHGSVAELHDGLTGAAGSFQQTVQGIRTLQRLGQTVITNTVITEQNYRDLPRLARLLVSLGVQQFQFAFPHILGSAERNRDWLVPRQREIMPYVYEGLQLGRDGGVRCLTEAIPFCLMSGYEEHIAEQVIPATRVYDGEHTLADYGSYRREKGKNKAPTCRDCHYEARCEGPWREYPAMFGWAEFRPVLHNPRGPE